MARESASKPDAERRHSPDSGRPSSVSKSSQRTNTTGLGRRSFLRLGVAATALGTSAAATNVAAATTVRGISFETVVNAVDDLGMDPSGSTPIDAALDSAIRSDTLIEFPPGEYLVTDEQYETGLDNFGIRGTGSSPSDVRFVFPAGNAGAPDPANYVMCWLEAGTGLLLENFEIHQTDDRETAASLVVYARDGLEVHDITWQGFNPISSYAKGTCLYPSVTDPSGVGNVSGLTIRDGGVLDTYPNRRMGILMQQNHVGELVFRDLDIRELGSTAVRATRCPGAVKIEDSYFENNDNASLRFGGNDHATKRSWAKRCRVVVDRSRLQHLDGGEEYEGIDGVRIDSNGMGWTDALVEACEFVYRSLPTDSAYSRGAIARPGWGDHGGFTVRDCTIRVDADDVPAVYAPTPGGDASEPHGVVLENVHVTGEQSTNSSNAVFYIEASDASAVRNCCLNVPNGGLDGVAISDSADCVVESSDIVVGGDATRFSGSTVTTSGLTSDGACRLPGDDVVQAEPPSYENELVVRGTGEPAQYSFDVTSELVGEGLERWDDLSGSTAVGWVTETTDVDTFRFDGEVSRFEMLSGVVDLTLNGEATTIPELTGGSTEESTGGSTGEQTDDTSGDATDEQTDARTIRLQGAGTKTNYEFHVSGSLSADPDADDLESWDTLSETSAEGWVTNEQQVDTYQFTGEILAFSYLEGEASVTVDGEAVDGPTLGMANTLEIRGYDAELPASYELAAETEVYPDPLAGEQGTTETSGNGAEGAVTDGVHRYLFDGSVTFFDIEGPGAVYLNGEQVDPADLVDGGAVLPNTIVFDGSTGGPTSYEFVVTGDVARSPDLGSAETADAVEAGVVAGTVDGDVDGFRFDGDLSSLAVDGSANVSFTDIDG